MKKLTLIVCGTLFAGAAAVVFAQNVKDDLVFLRFDKNRDGKIARAGAGGRGIPANDVKRTGE